MNQAIKVLFLLSFLSGIINAQDATIRGKVIDAELGEPLLGATVAINENGEVTGGTTTDLDGTYSLKVDPGTYQLVISYISYAPDSLQVEAIAGEVAYNETLLYEEGTIIETVVVKAKAIQSSDVAINLAKQNSINAIDGISVDFIKRTGDNNIAGALQRVTGVSVEDGKYVTVRGLGDRYSKNLLNGSEIPALDPERNTTQLDIFPSNLVDNIIVYKDFTPDLPGDFTGGLVDIRTKSHPEEFTLSFSASYSFNPTANLVDDFLTYEQGNIDWLGFDDGDRDIPQAVTDFENENGTSIPGFIRSTRDEKLAAANDEIAKSFPQFHTIEEKTSGINQSYQFAIGNQFDLGGRPFGYNLGISYRNAFQYREGFSIGRYNLQDAEGTTFERRNASGALTQEEALWGLIGGISYKLSDKNKLSLTYMHNQSGSNETLLQIGKDFVDRAEVGDSLVDRTMSFNERAIDAFQLKGQHFFGKLELDWIGGYIRSSDQQPDFRIAQYISALRDELIFDENGVPILDEFGQPVTESIRIFEHQGSVNRNPQRYYRDMTQNNLDLKVNFKLPIQVWSDREGNIKFGGAYTFKDREFEEKVYEIELDPGRFNSRDYIFRSTGDLSRALASDSMGIIGTTVNPNTGVTTFNFRASYEETSTPQNTYFADQTVTAGYAMLELPISERLKIIGGARYETTAINLETAPQFRW